MATSAGLSTLLNSENQWAFPRFDDQSPQAGHDDADRPRKAPRAVRIGVSLIIGIVVVALGISAAGVVVKAAGRIRPRHSSKRWGVVASPRGLCANRNGASPSLRLNRRNPAPRSEAGRFPAQTLRLAGRAV